MERKKFYIAKVLQKKNIIEAKEGSDFLGFAKLVIATTHVDREGDQIQKSFLRSMADDLRKNTTGFYNHLTEKLPISKTTKVELIKMDGDNEGIELTMGFSKTAPDHWQLVKEGVLNKASVGGVITDMEFNSDTGGFLLKSGNAYEPSIVGIPANPNAEIKEVLKGLRKSYREQSKVNNKDIEDETTMDDEQLKAFAKNLVKDTSEAIKVKYDDVLDKERAKSVELEKSLKDFKTQTETENADLVKQMELAKLNAEEKERELEELKKGMNGGRQGSASQNADYSDIYKDKDEVALAKGMNDFGKFLLEARDGDEIIMEGSRGTEAF